MVHRDLVPISAKALRKWMDVSDKASTQTQLASHSGVSQSVISAILRGAQRRVVRNKLLALSKALNVFSDQLKNDPSDPTYSEILSKKPTELVQKKKPAERPVDKPPLRMKCLAPAIIADVRLAEIFPIIRQCAERIAFGHDPPLEKIEAILKSGMNKTDLRTVVLRWNFNGEILEQEFVIDWLPRRRTLRPLGLDKTE